MNSSGLFQRDIFGRVLLLEGEISLLNLYIGKMCFSLFDIQRLSQKLSLAIHTCDSRSFTAKQKMLVSFFFFAVARYRRHSKTWVEWLNFQYLLSRFFPPRLTCPCHRRTLKICTRERESGTVFFISSFSFFFQHTHTQKNIHVGAAETTHKSLVRSRLRASALLVIQPFTFCHCLQRDSHTESCSMASTLFCSVLGSVILLFSRVSRGFW